MDHPSFFHSLCSIRGDGGFLPGGEPSSLSESAGTVFVLLGELVLFLNTHTPHNNKPGLSSIVDRRRNLPHTSRNKPQPEAK
jgi:hypothetical protein